MEREAWPWALHTLGAFHPSQKHWNNIGEGYSIHILHWILHIETLLDALMLVGDLECHTASIRFSPSWRGIFYTHVGN